MMEKRPIVYDSSTGNMILGGNMRFRACKENGMKEIPVTWVKDAVDLTEEEKKRFIAVDNVPFGDWDFELLANSFDMPDLIEWGFDEKDFGIKISEGDEGIGLIPEKDPNIICRISFHPGLWLGKREEILLIFEQMKKTYSCEVKVEE